MQTVLITGGAGYIGSILVKQLVNDGYRVKILDRFFFGEGELAEMPNVQLIRADIRSVTPANFEGVDIVMDLAGLSNDPTCDLSPALTTAINYQGCVRVARFAAEAQVKRYLFSSSCSIYGHGETILTETSEVKPITRYAEAKLKAEQAILETAAKYPKTTFTLLRNATVFGLSARMRFDLVVNLMTLNAFTKGRIYVMGNGQHWRPLIHVSDVARAFRLVATADPAKVSQQIINVGDNRLNFRVITIAYQIKSVLTDSEIDLLQEDPERRDYQICFDKIRTTLGFEANYTVSDGVEEIVAALRNGTLIPDDRRWYTLAYYKFLLEAESLYKKLNIKGKIL